MSALMRTKKQKNWKKSMSFDLRNSGFLQEKNGKIFSC